MVFKSAFIKFPLLSQARIAQEINSEHLRAGFSLEAPKLHDPHSRVVFYNMRFCMYAQRTALVLLAKKLE